jgi:3-hydroxyisobutyrate dehydrogenase-like beta-hydroxyacid dehydrogenase
MKQYGANRKVTVGMLYCGDMGSAVGKLLRKAGLRVVTTCQGRSRTTQEQALKSGVEILPSFDEVVARSHYVFSLVLPSAAIDVAKQYADRYQICPPGSVFIEANNIGLEPLEQIKNLMASKNIPLVDATIHGVAQRLEDVAVLHISGPQAKNVEALFQGLMRVNWLGTRVGSASLMKQLMSAISKSLPSLFLEVGALADRSDMLEPFLESCNQFYPALMTVIERTLPTYPRHAVRRAAEVSEIEQLARAYQLRPGMIHEAGGWIQFIASLPWEQKSLEAPADIRTIIHRVAKACPHDNE